MMPGWLFTIITSVTALAYLFILARFIGKREISQLSMVDFIVSISLGSIASEMAMNIDGSIVHGLIGMTIFGGFPLLTAWLSLKSKAIRNLFEGKPTILIKDGKILEDNLKKERLTNEDLLGMLRSGNTFRVADVEFAIMESSGKLSILPKAENQPLTPKTMGLTVAPAEEPQTVILDGVIMDEPLATSGKNRQWLHTELSKLGVAQENVFIGQVDASGGLYVDLYDDKIQVPEPTAPKLTYATLKKCQADMELYALSTSNEEMKRQYTLEAERLQKLIQLLKPLLIGEGVAHHV